MNDENPGGETAPTTSSTTDAPQGSRANDGGAPSAQTTPKADPKPGTGVYAVYDLRYEKFVGGTSRTKPSKADAKRLAGHDDVEVREV